MLIAKENKIYFKSQYIVEQLDKEQLELGKTNIFF